MKVFYIKDLQERAQMLVTAIKAIVFVVCFGVTMGVVYPSYEEKKALSKKEKKKASCLKEEKEKHVNNS
jgi:hypothetical protein